MTEINIYYNILNHTYDQVHHHRVIECRDKVPPYMYIAPNAEDIQTGTMPNVDDNTRTQLYKLLTLCGKTIHEQRTFTVEARQALRQSSAEQLNHSELWRLLDPLRLRPMPNVPNKHSILYILSDTEPVHPSKKARPRKSRSQVEKAQRIMNDQIGRTRKLLQRTMS